MSNELEARVQGAYKLVEHLLSEMKTYHSHKETMAHAALLVMLAFCGAILKAEKWPPNWVLGLQVGGLCSQQLTFLAVFILWLFIHIYMRWQLRNRRAAAITYAGSLRALAEWATRCPVDNDLNQYCPESTRHKFLAKIGGWLATLLDYVVPFPWATVHYDVGKEAYPKWLGKAIRQEEKRRTGAIKAECLVTIGSFFVLFIIVVRTLY